jgi:hypothetical protein
MPLNARNLAKEAEIVDPPMPPLTLKIKMLALVILTPHY